MERSTRALLLASAAATFATSSFTQHNEPMRTNTFVLVHGAWQAPYVWDAVRTDLEKAGNNVIVVGLPGHGSDKTPPHTLSIDAYSNAVMDAMATVQTPVILVGHSMAGMVISNVAERMPEKIAKLVYIGAFLPANGQALTDLAYSDPDSKLGPALVPSADQLTIDVKPENLTDLFIADGTPADQALVQANYRAEPAIPFTNKVTLSAERFGAVQKVYVKTLQDVVISPGLQDRMIAAAGITDVRTVDTSHSPFLAKPTEVSELLKGTGR